MKTKKHAYKALISLILVSASSHSALILPDDPLVLTRPASHNLFLTLDNSGSMFSSWGGSSISSNLNWYHRVKIPETNSLAYNSLIQYSKWPGKDASGNDLYPDITDLTAVNKIDAYGGNEGKVSGSTIDYTRKDKRFSNGYDVFGTLADLQSIPDSSGALIKGNRYRYNSDYKNSFNIIRQVSYGADERGKDTALDWLRETALNLPANLSQSFSYVKVRNGFIDININDEFKFNGVGRLPMSLITCSGWSYTPTRVVNINTRSSDGKWVATGKTKTLSDYSKRSCYVDFSTATNIDVDNGSGGLTPLSNIYKVYTRKFDGYKYPYYFRVWDDKNQDGKMNSYSESVLIKIKPATVFPSNRTWEEELRNYAYWEQYNNRRITIAKKAIGQLITSMDHSPSLEVEYSSLNGASNTSIISDLSQNNNQSNLLNKLYRTRQGGLTPLREKIEEIGNKLVSNTGHKYYRLDENNEPTGSCSESYNISITDGAWTDNSNFTLMGNADGDNTSLYDGPPYSDPWSNTLADTTMKYYETDLQPQLSDDLATSDIDKATHQHLVNHFIGFDLKGNVSSSDDLNAGINWQEPVNNAAKVDDIRHAAFNSRGKYFSATGSNDLALTLSGIAGSITSQVSSLAAVSISTTKLDIDTRLFIANFETDRWSGHLFAYELLNTSTGEVNQTPLFDAGKVLTNRDLINNPRNIITYNSAIQQGVTFDRANLDSDWIADLSFTKSTTKTQQEIDTLIDDRIKWIKGTFIASTSAAAGASTAGTAAGGTAARGTAAGGPNTNSGPKTVSNNQLIKVTFGLTGAVSNATIPRGTFSFTGNKQLFEMIFKSLSSLLGRYETNFGLSVSGCYPYNGSSWRQYSYCYLTDIVETLRNGLSLFNQDELRERKSLLGDIIHSNPVYVKAPDLRLTDTDYLSFKALHSTRVPMIYIGSNDGMLHAFNADTGIEQFAYLPKALVNKADKTGYHYLTQESYKHRYYVDGSLTASDVKVNGVWKTILVGAYRSGGMGYFALDITDPASFSDTSQAKNRVLWEFTDTDLLNQGRSFSRAKIIKGNNGQYYVGFGNGVNSANGAASLILLDIAGGMDGNWSNSDVIELTTTDNTENGLFSPTFIDIDNDGDVDFAYAGDINGSLWKFDLSSSSSSGWSLSMKLFKTASGESITSEPSVSMVRGQRMIFIGAGRFITKLDKKNAGLKQRYFYGFIDNDVFVDGASDLVTQDVVGTSDNRTLTDYNINFDLGQVGWRIKLPDSGEMSVTRSILRDGIVYFNTFTPTPSTCGGIGYGYKYAAQMSNGGQPKLTIFDVNQDNVVDANDNINQVSGSGVISSIKMDGYLPEPVFIEDIQYSNLNNQRIIKIKDFKTGLIYWIELK